MTTISAKIIADSVSPAGNRLTTLQLRYPLIIHAELMTHRALSRNARSSRAVPIATMIREAEEDPFVPLHWGAAEKGMQAYSECENYVDVSADFEATGETIRPVSREEAWLMARDDMVEYARSYAEAGYAKQLVNRLLAPFLHIDTLVSATEWDGFFEQRVHRAAEPHMHFLAERIGAALIEGKPKLLQLGEWHLPYMTRDEDAGVGIIIRRQLSAARCARISYAPFDGDASIASELRRYDHLVGSRPIHASPCEHQATPDLFDGQSWFHKPDHRNFVGWRQNRAIIERELRT